MRLAALAPSHTLDAASLIDQTAEAMDLSAYDPRFPPFLQALMDHMHAADMHAGLPACVTEGLTRRHLAVAATRSDRAYAAVPLTRPLVVVGLPRTGTTLLHNLLCAAGPVRYLRYWETLETAVPTRPERMHTDPRVKTAEDACAAFIATCPDILRMHPLSAHGPEECNNLLTPFAASPILFWFYNIPGYLSWLTRQDLRPAYGFYAHQLRLLGRHFPGRRWVLKAPAHLYFLDALFDALPDACVIHTHRRPEKAVVSACSLGRLLRGTTGPVDAHEVGRQWLPALAESTDRAMAFRARRPDADIVDVGFQSLLDDPVGVVARIYAHAGLPFDATSEARIAAWQRDNQRNKHGHHRYEASQFGLKDAEIAERFAAYRATYAAYL